MPSRVGRLVSRQVFLAKLFFLQAHDLFHWFGLSMLQSQINRWVYLESFRYELWFLSFYWGISFKILSPPHFTIVVFPALRSIWILNHQLQPWFLWHQHVFSKWDRVFTGYCTRAIPHRTLTGSSVVLVTQNKMKLQVKRIAPHRPQSSQWVDFYFSVLPNVKFSTLSSIYNMGNLKSLCLGTSIFPL